MGIREKLLRRFQKEPPEINLQKIEENLEEVARETIQEPAGIPFEKEALEAEILEIDEKLDRGILRGRIKQIFRHFTKQAKPEDIKNIEENLDEMNRGPIQEIWPKIQALAKMLRDPKAAWGSKALAIAALLYLISPLDAVPDVIPVAGLADDAAVIIAVVSTLAYQVEKYVTRSAEKGVEIAEEIADIQVRKYNRIVRITLIGSILAAVLAIAVKLILKHI